MENNSVSQAVHASEPTKQSAVGRVQVYRESRGGNSILRFGTDSDAEAVEGFVVQVHAYAGDDVRILAQTEQRMVAFVEMCF